MENCMGRDLSPHVHSMCENVATALPTTDLVQGFSESLHSNQSQIVMIKAIVLGAHYSTSKMFRLKVLLRRFCKNRVC